MTHEFAGSRKLNLYLGISCRLILGLVWLVTALLKGLDFQSFNSILREQYNLHRYFSYLAVFLPVVETAVGLSLLIEFRVKDALRLSIGLLTVLSFIIAYGMLGGNLEACGCFGALDTTSPAMALLRNTVLIAMAFCALRFEPSPPAPRGWKGWVLSLACIVAALTTGSSVHQPHFQEKSLQIGDQFPTLEVGIPELPTGPTLVFGFYAECSKCWDAIPQIKTFSHQPTLKIVGFTPSPLEKIKVYEEELTPGFPIHQVSEEWLKKFGSKIPLFILVKDGIIEFISKGPILTEATFIHFNETWYRAFLELDDSLPQVSP